MRDAMRKIVDATMRLMVQGVKEIGENLEKASLFSAALHDNPWVEPSGVRPLSHVLPYLAQ